jgi:hypothetical protein
MDIGSLHDKAPARTYLWTDHAHINSERRVSCVVQSCSVRVEAVDVGINIRRPRVKLRCGPARKAEHHLAHALNTLLIEIVHTTQSEFVP